MADDIDVTRQVCEVLSEYTIKTVLPRATLQGLFQDSLSIIQGLLAVEEFFHLDDIPNDVVDRFVTVQDVIAYVEQHRV